MVLVVFDDVGLLDATGPIQVLHGSGGYRIRLASPDGDTVRSDVGVQLKADVALGSVDAAFDILIVPGYPLDAGPPPASLIEAVRRLSRLARRVVTVCTGALVLAEAGLLHGRQVTTHWAACADLAARFPTTTVWADRIFVRDGNLLTSAGVTAGIDAALALVEDDHGAARARTVAKHLVVFLQRPGGQSQFSVRNALHTTSNAALRAVMDYVVANPAHDHRPAVLAERAILSERHLSRVFQQHVGLTPARWVEQVRVQAAQAMLETDDAGVGAVARACGFGSDETMRRAFLRVTGIPPDTYRGRFRTSATES